MKVLTTIATFLFISGISHVQCIIGNCLNRAGTIKFGTGDSYISEFKEGKKKEREPIPMQAEIHKREIGRMIKKW